MPFPHLANSGWRLQVFDLVLCSLHSFNPLLHHPPALLHYFLFCLLGYWLFLLLLLAENVIFFITKAIQKCEQRLMSSASILLSLLLQTFTHLHTLTHTKSHTHTRTFDHSSSKRLQNGAKASKKSARVVVSAVTAKYLIKDLNACSALLWRAERSREGLISGTAVLPSLWKRTGHRMLLA